MPVVAASAGDHAAIHQFLTGVFQGPTAAEFAASLEDPFYEPNDRLLLYRGRQILGHALVTHRVMQIGTARVPIAGLDWLAVASECANRGLGTHLLQAAEKSMAGSGAVAGMLSTSVPRFFGRNGWAACHWTSHSRANVHAVLSTLMDSGLYRRRRRPLRIRPWRQWEHSALERIYDRNIDGGTGWLERTGPYWQWLIRRHAYDRLYVALDGREPARPDQTPEQIVGYAVTRGPQIVELLTKFDRHRAVIDLLVHCCGDVIEQGGHHVGIHAPPDSALHELLGKAGGQWKHGPIGEGRTSMVRLLNPLKLLRLLSAEFYFRAEAAGLPRPLELGLLIGRRKFQIEVTRMGVKVAARRIGRSYLAVPEAEFPLLVFGQLDWDHARAWNRVEASTGLAEEAGRALFPRLPLWRPPLDNLRA